MNVMNYLKGKIKEAKMMIISPKTPINDIIGVTVLSVWASCMPDILVTTQNPESFIQGIGLDPQPTASARYTG